MNTRPELHPACAAFPAMPEKDLQELAADIKQHGLLEEITMTPDGLLLDGRCRWDACEIAGVEPRTIQYHGDDPVGFVLSKNRHRRHLNKSQMALIVAGMVNMTRGGQQDNRNASKTKTNTLKKNIRSADDLSKQSDVPLAYTNYGRTLLKHGAPHVIDMVRKGEVNVRVAAEAVRMIDPAEQVGWTKKDVEEEGNKVIRAYPSNQAKAAAPKPARKPATPAFRRPQAPPMPTYWPTPMTDEERGFPPKETWHEPDPDRPGLNKYQGHIAKHGHVHIMPLATRQAQDRLIASRRLNSQLREVIKPLRALMSSEPPLVDLADLAKTLNEAKPEDVQTIMRRLTAVLAEIMPDLAATWHYVNALNNMIAALAQVTPESAAADCA